MNATLLCYSVYYMETHSSVAPTQQLEPFKTVIQIFNTHLLKVSNFNLEFC